MTHRALQSDSVPPLSSPPAAQQSASRRPRTLTALVLVVAALLAALAAAPAADAALKARGSIKQAYVLGAKKGRAADSTGAAGS